MYELRPGVGTDDPGRWQDACRSCDTLAPRARTPSIQQRLVLSHAALLEFLATSTGAEFIPAHFLT